MADIQVEEKTKGKKKPKLKKQSTHIDFTPMVDLGFLLITFFMLTTSMAKPQTMEISVPTNKTATEEQQNKVKASQAVTILIGDENRVYYYFGAEEDGIPPELVESDYSKDGLRRTLIRRNIEVMNAVAQLKVDKENKKINDEEFKQKAREARDSKAAPNVLIKATDNSSYKNLVDVLDEMQICNIARYTIVDIDDYDLGLIENLNNPGATSGT